MTGKTVTGLAPGKLILFGEYAVLEGAPALVMAVDRWARVEISPVTGNEHFVSSPTLQVEKEPFVITPKKHVRFDPAREQVFIRRLHFFSLIFESALQQLTGNATIPFSAMDILLDTSAFYSSQLKAKLGFGSSAALTSALVFALTHFLNKKLTRKNLFKTAFWAHHHAQGKLGSGIDVAASVYGGTLIYRKPGEDWQHWLEPEQQAPWQELALQAIWTGQSASTKRFVTGVGQLKEKVPQVYDQIMARLITLSEQGCKAYKQRAIQDFLALVEQFFSTLRELGEKSNMPIISQGHLWLAEQAVRHGLRYKPSGAGGGDMGLLFAEDKERIAWFVKEQLTNQPFYAVPISAAVSGVHCQQ